MTAEGMIRAVDALKPNAFTMAQKLGWLDDVENAVWREVLLQDAEEAGALRPGTALMLPESFERLYRLYLTAMIDFSDAEFTKYSNAMALYNEAWQSLAAWYAGRFRPADRPAVRAKLGTVTYNDTADPVRTVLLPEGAALIGVSCRVTEAFDDGETALRLVTGHGRTVMGAGEIAPGRTGLYEKRCLFVTPPLDRVLEVRMSSAGTGSTGRAEFELRIQPGKECSNGNGQ